MGSKRKERNEQLVIMHEELRAHGIHQWHERPTAMGHVIISFEKPNGEVAALTVGGSGDSQARFRNRSILRQLLEGRR